MMTVAAYFENLSIEGLFLLSGMIGLLVIILGLHFRNIRWMRQIAANQASLEARARIERLIASVEQLAEKPKSTTIRARPINKKPKFVPAARTSKPAIPYIRAR